MNMKPWAKHLIKWLALTVMLLGLPLLGVTLAGQPVTPFLEFPPLTRYVVHAPFSWPVFAALAMLAAALFAGMLLLLWPAQEARAKQFLKLRSFPWWGWLALMLLICFWVLAWNRFSWLQALQAHTFTPLWLSFIVLLNAMSYRRTGACLMLDRPGYFLTLFPASALFWWYFEFLNRFVQNWHYIGIEEFSPLTYALHASLSFATVLPAVMSMLAWLQSFDRLAGGRFGRPYRLHHARRWAWLALVAGGLGLAGIGLKPDVLFSLLWIAPMLIIVSMQVLLHEKTVFSPLAGGDWRLLAQVALAALACGLFWEMWNMFSYAKWVYSVPLVQRFEIFEMPLLGYAGYLPFGLECLVIADWLAGLMGKTKHP